MPQNESAPRRKAFDGLMFPIVLGIVLWIGLYLMFFNSAAKKPLLVNFPEGEKQLIGIAEWGQIGDSFGAFNALASFAVLIAVYATYRKEHDDSNERAKEHAIQVAMMVADSERRDRQHAEQIARMSEQTEVSLRLLQFEAKKFRYERLRRTIEANNLKEQELRSLARTPGNQAWLQVADELAKTSSDLIPECEELEKWFARARDGII